MRRAAKHFEKYKRSAIYMPFKDSCNTTKDSMLMNALYVVVNEMNEGPYEDLDELRYIYI